MAGTSHLIRYWHTLRHLKLVQIYGRLRVKVRKIRPDLRPASPLRVAQSAFVQPIAHPPSLLGPAEFQFLNVQAKLAPANFTTNVPDLLWQFNLHYFDDLNAQSNVVREEWHRTLLQRWVAEVLPGHDVAWHPYPLSLRVVNWVKWVLRGNKLQDAAIDSLCAQLRVLSAQPEYHVLGNHLFANAKALVFGGLFFSGEEADHWRDQGLQILLTEIPEQILNDGGHFERSPMYHAKALEDMLDLRNITQAYANSIPDRWRLFTESWPKTIAQMQNWLAAMTHPDGEIAFFNDAAFRIAPPLCDLGKYAERLGLARNTPMNHGVRDLRDSGYIAVVKNGAKLLVDVAPLGPDYLLAHAHADTLSFELSLGNDRVFVNSGTSCYGNTPQRSIERGTKAHNTVTINDTDSSEVWKSFRVGRRAAPLGLKVENDENAVTIRCTHNGYDFLPGSPRHMRIWSMAENSLTIEDEVDGIFGCAEARFHLHPQVMLDEHDNHHVLSTPDGHRLKLSIEGGKATIENGSWYPEFGKSFHNKCLVARFGGARVVTHIEWSD